MNIGAVITIIVFYVMHMGARYAYWPRPNTYAIILITLLVTTSDRLYP